MSAERFASNPARRARRRMADRVFALVCFLAAAVAATIIIVILGKLLIDGLPRLSLEFLTRMPSQIRPEKAGVLSALVGSLYIMGLTALFAVPVGVAAAVYLEEFVQRKTRLSNLIEVNIANLSGVPSIVYGMLGIAVFVIWMRLDRSLLAGALTMSLLILPLVILVSREALRAVPGSFRDASLALGATRWQTIRRVVLPQATPGILTGIVLALSRAIGETAPLIVVGAVGLVTFLPRGVGDRYTVLPLQILDWSSQPKQAFHEAAAGAILVLMALLLLMNSFAIILRSRRTSTS